jgi:hypothetical protein
MTDANNDELVGVEEASRVLEVPVEQVHTMVEQGLVTPVEGSGGDARFRRSELTAARLQGG